MPAGTWTMRAGGLDGVVLLDLDEVAEKNGADLALVEVQGHAHDGRAVGGLELEKLAGHRAAKTLDASDTVADLRRRCRPRGTRRSC